MLYRKEWDNTVDAAMAAIDKTFKPAVPSLKYPSVEGYIYLLRHKELWPQSVNWGKHWAPQIDLANAFWPNSATRASRANNDLTEMLAMGINFQETADRNLYVKIFFGHDNDGDGFDVSAETLAVRLETFLNRADPGNTKAFAAIMALRLGC